MIVYSILQNKDNIFVYSIVHNTGNIIVFGSVHYKLYDSKCCCATQAPASEFVTNRQTDQMTYRNIGLSDGAKKTI